MMGSCASSSSAALTLSRLPISSASSSSCFLRKNGRGLIPLSWSSSLSSLFGSRPPPPLLSSSSSSSSPLFSLHSPLFCAPSSSFSSSSSSVLHVKHRDQFKPNPNSNDDVDDGLQHEEQEEEEEEEEEEAKLEEEEEEEIVQQQVEKLEVPQLTVKEKKELSSFAHKLGKKLKSQQVGKSGVTQSVATSFIENLESNELLKIKIHGSCPGELIDVIKQLEEGTGSVAVDQIGRSVILYRPSLSQMKKREKAAKIQKSKEYRTSGTQKKAQAPRSSSEGRRQLRQV